MDYRHWICKVTVILTAYLPLTHFAYAEISAKEITDIQAVELKNALPGAKIPYYLRNDEGSHYLIAGMNLNIMARGQDTNDQYEIMTWTGGKGLGLPLHQFSNSHHALYVMEGQVELWLANKHYLLNKGDYVSIPEKTEFSFRFRSHRTKLFNWATGIGSVASLTILGTPTQTYVQPETGKTSISSQALKASQKLGFVTWLGLQKAGTAEIVQNAILPKQAQPYVLAAHEGERYVAGDQVYTYLGDIRGSHGRFLAVMTEGPKGVMIPTHYHKQHTEIFIPTEGSLTLIANSQKLIAYPGDVVNIPAGTIHAYQLNDHYTQFLGFLTPGVFENFFKTLGDPYQPYIFPAIPGKLHFDRIMRHIDKFDLYVVGK